MVNFTRKKCRSKSNLLKKKCSISDQVQVRSQNRQNDHFGGVGQTHFFSLKKKLIMVFFGVKFTSDYYDFAIISNLNLDQSQKSKKPIFLSFFRLLTVVPK